eukprot:s164_g34.t1
MRWLHREERFLRELSNCAEGRKRKLSDKDVFFLNLFKVLIQRNAPREVRSLGRDNVVVFTDACYEGKAMTGRAALEEKILGELEKKQIIYEAETLAAVVAFFLWQENFVNQRCLLFLDNEGTKFSWPTGISDNPTVDVLAEFFADLESRVHAFIWLACVPSKSNIADPPSRGDTRDKFFQAATNVSKDAKVILDKLVTQISESVVEGCVPSQRSKRAAACAFT